MSRYKYYKILTSKGELYNGNIKREERWHDELQCTLSSEFWKKARHQYSLIDSDNTLKWLQFRVVRNCLPTNKIVCKFVNNVQPICSFCLDPSSLELISHIYWHCPKIKHFFMKLLQGQRLLESDMNLLSSNLYLVFMKRLFMIHTISLLYS